MINTIIFDFGDIFINLEKQAQIDAFAKIGIAGPTPELIALSDQLEIGKMSEFDFINNVVKYTNNASMDEIRDAWNAVIGDFPLHRLEFLQMLAAKYRLFLLTNTDEIHISKFEHKAGMSFYTDFYRCFEKIYYSYEMGMRKPNPDVFKTIIRNHDLTPKRTLFVDDKKSNTDVAESLGLHIWNLQVGKEDVVDLFKQKQLPL